MKRALAIGGSLLILNVLIGLLLSKYATFNMCLNSAIILITTVLIVLLDKVHLSTAFKISLGYLFGFIGAIEYVVGFFSKATLTDNWIVITYLTLLVIEVLILIVTNAVSTKANN